MTPIPPATTPTPKQLLRRAEALDRAGYREAAQALRRQAEELQWPDGFWGETG